jgi:hypothetical protein
MWHRAVWYTPIHPEGLSILPYICKDLETTRSHIPGDSNLRLVQLVNNKLERKWKEVVVTKYGGICLRGDDEIAENSVAIADTEVAIGTPGILNKTQETPLDCDVMCHALYTRIRDVIGCLMRRYTFYIITYWTLWNKFWVKCTQGFGPKLMFEVRNLSA